VPFTDMEEATASLLEVIASAERIKLPDGADFHVRIYCARRCCAMKTLTPVSHSACKCAATKALRHRAAYTHVRCNAMQWKNPTSCNQAACNQVAQHAPALQYCRIHATHQPSTVLVQYFNTMEDFRDPAAEAGRRLRRLAAAAAPTDSMAAGSAEAALEGGALSTDTR
jgi:hypothetical protein